MSTAPAASEVVSQSSSPILSPTLAARISLQKLTNFIPLPSLPWSSPVLGQAASAAASLCLVSTSSSSSSVSEDPQTSPSFTDAASSASSSQPARRYISREQQLQKLRARLETENRAKARVPATTSP